LARHLLQLDDHEFSRLQRRKADDDVDHAEIDVVLSGGLFVALHEVSVLRRLPLKRSLAKQNEKAPDETLLVVDATTGSNALSQARDRTGGVGAARELP